MQDGRVKLVFAKLGVHCMSPLKTIMLQWEGRLKDMMSDQFKIKMRRAAELVTQHRDLLARVKQLPNPNSDLGGYATNVYEMMKPLLEAHRALAAQLCDARWIHGKGLAGQDPDANRNYGLMHSADMHLLYLVLSIGAYYSDKESDVASAESSLQRMDRTAGMNEHERSQNHTVMAALRAKYGMALSQKGKGP